MSWKCLEFNTGVYTVLALWFNKCTCNWFFKCEESCWLEVKLKVIRFCKCLYNWGWNLLHPQSKTAWDAMCHQVIRWICWMLWCYKQNRAGYFFWLFSLDVGNHGCILAFRTWAASLTGCSSPHGQGMESHRDGPVKNPQAMGNLLAFHIQSVK